MKKLKTKLKYKWLVFFVLTWFLMYKFVDKQSLIGVIQKSLPRQEASLLAGMVWGEKAGMSYDFNNLLKNTGLVHIVVVSGANLMIVGKNLIENLAKFMGRKMAIVWGGGVILFYVNLVGWQIPVIRALIILAIFYWAQIIGRRFVMWRALLVVGLMMFLADFKVISNVSFWLSMAAFTAIILSQSEGILKNTIWVSLFIMPILSIVFGKISLVSPLTNFGVLFLVEILTVIGFIGSLIALLFFDLGRIILLIGYPFLRYFIEVVEGMGKIGGVLNFQFNWWMLAGWYLIIGGYWYEKKKV